MQIDCTCGDYLCGEVKTQLRMCQRIENMPKACPYAMAMSVLKYWIINLTTKKDYDC